MERDIIVYFGMGFLPDNNAVACREQVFSFISKQSDYTPVLIGINNDVSFNSYKKYVFNDVCCYDIKYAKTALEKLKDTSAIKKTLVNILEDIGTEKIKCFIMQDYQLGPMRYLKKYCKANGIAFAADIMDWFVPSRYFSIVKNISKSFDTFLRMHWFYKSLDNKICISHKFKNYFKSKKNILVFPSTCNDAEKGYEKTSRANQPITISFAGGLRDSKDKERIDWVIKALYENKSGIIFNVIGVTEEQFLCRFPKSKDFITNNINFLGYKPHRECVKILKNSDFSIIVRKSNKLTEFGFSNKICEAFAYGIPVITTNTSDNNIYIKNGINGYICAPDYNSFKKLLKEVEKLDRDSIDIMNQQLEKSNPLSADNYIDDFSEFINNLRV